MTSSSSGLTMLTSGVSQYLHPDYLQPLPTTLDAKKSPLALLAQTCSAIGKDTSPSKPIIPPLERKDVEKADKDSESSNSKRPSSHGHKDSGRDSKPGFRTFPPKEIPPLVPISACEKSMRTTSSVEPKASTSPSSNSGMNLSSTSSSRPVSAGGHHSSTSGQRSSSRSSNGKSEMSMGGDHHQQHSGHHHSSHHKNRDSPASSGASTHPSTSSPSFSRPISSHSTSVMQSSPLSSSVKPTPSHQSLLSGLPSAAHLAGYPSHLALMSHGLDPATSSYHSALAAHSSLSSFTAAAAAAQSSALKAAAAGNASALSSFVTYARVRTPSGATTLVPVCRDPYCTNCQLTLQNSHLSSTCNAPGCSQCAHEKSLTSLSALGLPGAGATSMLLPSLSPAGSLSSMSALSSLHSLYPHSALAAAAAAAHQGLPYVCNWVSGNDYCGKRFTSSEDLLQHLRTHTSSMDVSTLAASYAGLGLPSLSAAYPHLSAPLSPNSLRRAYPTSLSPVSSLLGASRYHPYKSPMSAVGATPPAPQSFPVGPYYSPYTLYGQRLGAAVVP